MAQTSASGIKTDDGKPLASWRVQQDPSCCGVMLVDHFVEEGRILKATYDEAIQKLINQYKRIGVLSCTFMIENRSMNHDMAPKTHEAFLRNGFKEVLRWKNPRTGSVLSSLMYVYPAAEVN